MSKQRYKTSLSGKLMCSGSMMSGSQVLYCNAVLMYIDKFKHNLFKKVVLLISSVRHVQKLNLERVFYV